MILTWLQTTGISINKKEIISVSRFHKCQDVFIFPPNLQIINYGVILHKGAYFRDEWNFIDALVVSCAIASLVLR